MLKTPVKRKKSQPKTEEEVKIVEKIIEKEVEKEVEKIVYKTVWYKVTSNSNGILTIQFVVDGLNYSLGLSNPNTGCGLGAFHSFVNYSILYENKAKIIPILKEILKIQCTAQHWFCLIATLGDDFMKPNTFNNVNWPEWLKEIGFVEIHSYNNKNHGKDYQQHIYQLDISKLLT